ncbi:Na+/H+ antiporter family protein [Peptoniphilus sp. oral taxon 375 str. F0436]|nr:Na+/H+ antiporter family protein [Peptoniphilus sp. oral taxon 375 str. F0436]
MQGKFCEKKSLFLYVKRLFFPGLIDKLIEFESIWRYFLKIFKNILKFSPVAVLAWLLLAGKGYNEAGSLEGFDMLIAGPMAFLYAGLVAFITEGIKPKEIVDIAVESVQEIEVVFFILMLAYAMAGVFMSTGVGAAIVNAALKVGISARIIAPLSLVVTGILSVATGTSWGTFAACAPIFLWLNHIVAGNMLLTLCAVTGGACFGDNLGLISDTTVVSSGIQNVEIIDRIRHQGIWAVGSLVLAVVLFYLASAGLPTHSASGAEAYSNIPQKTLDFLALERPDALSLLQQVRDGVPAYMMIPLILVIVVAILGVQTIFCLSVGIIAALFLGLKAGTVVSIPVFLEEIVQVGFAEAGAWVVVMMMWISAFGGVMNHMKAFDPLAKLVLRMSTKVRHLMTWNAVLSMAGNALLADEMAQIVTVGPIIRELVDKNIEGSEEDMYTLRLRNATFSSALGVFGAQMIPWHVYIAYYVGIANAVYPLADFKATDFIKYNFMGFVAIISLVGLTFTGLDRFIPFFKLPSEPDVRLKKQAE